MSFLQKTPFWEQTLKQLVLKDLYCQRFNSLYKHHSEQTVAWAKKFSQEVQLNTSQKKVLVAGAYAYDYGCSNLANGLDQKHEGADQHLPACFKYAGSKIERLITYRCGREFKQAELLQLVDILEDQVAPAKYLQKNEHSQLSQLLFEASFLAWLQLAKKSSTYLDYQHLKQQVKNLPLQLVRTEAALIIAGG